MTEALKQLVQTSREEGVKQGREKGVWGATEKFVCKVAAGVSSGQIVGQAGASAT